MAGFARAQTLQPTITLCCNSIMSNSDGERRIDFSNQSDDIPDIDDSLEDQADETGGCNMVGDNDLMMEFLSSSQDEFTLRKDIDSIYKRLKNFQLTKDNDSDDTQSGSFANYDDIEEQNQFEMDLAEFQSMEDPLIGSKERKSIDNDTDSFYSATSDKIDFQASYKSEAEELILTPTSKKSDWVDAILSLEFDIDTGQKIDFFCAKNLVLTDAEKDNIRFSSFPDTSGNIGDTIFSFRISRALPSPKFMYGYVLFRQKADSTRKRGFMQKSIVILSHLPYPGLFLRMVSILGSGYFEVSNNDRLKEPGNFFLEDAYNQTNFWQKPIPGNIVSLNFMGMNLKVDIPAKTSSNELGSVQLLESSGFISRSVQVSKKFAGRQRSLGTTAEQILAGIPCTLLFPTGFLAYLPTSCPQIDTQISSSFSKIPSPYFDLELLSNPIHEDMPGTSLGMFFRFKDILEDAWTIWELLIVGESIAVIGKSQCVVSECVWWLTDLIKPIPFCGDFRPYFTIQDTDFKKFCKYQNTSLEKKQCLIIGATNPYFLKAFENWPHILKVGFTQTSSKSVPYSNDNSPEISTKKELRYLSRSSSPVMGGLNNSKGPKDINEGLITNYRAFLRKDKNLIKILREAYAEGIQQRLPAAKKTFAQSVSSMFSVKSNSASESHHKVFNERGVSTKQKRYKGFVLNELLRRYFVDLTENFLAPLNRYFVTLMPSSTKQLFGYPTVKLFLREGSAIKYKPPLSIAAFQIKPFIKSDFLDQLHKHGPPPITKFRHAQNPDNGKASAILSTSMPSQFKSSAMIRGNTGTMLYARFLESPHFLGWIREKSTEARTQLRQSYIEDLLSLSFESIGAHEEIQARILEIYLALRRECFWAGIDIVTDDLSKPFDLEKYPPLFEPDIDLLWEMRRKGHSLWKQMASEIQEVLLAGDLDSISKLDSS